MNHFGAHPRSHNHRERIVIDFDEFGSILRRMTRFGNDCRDGFALIANFIYSKCIILDFLSRPRSDFRKRMRYGGEFRTCQRADNTACRGRLRYIDSCDPSMGIGRSHKLEIQHSLQLVVISEDALSLNEAGIFQSRQRPSDPFPCSL